MKIILYKEKLIDEWLLNHVKAECGVLNSDLFESHGYLKGMSIVVSPLCRLIMQKMDELKKGGHVDMKINNMSIFKGKVFFQNFMVNVSIDIDPKIKLDPDAEEDIWNLCDGEYDLKHSILFDKDGEIYFYPIINIMINGQSINELFRKLNKVLAHEFTHAYNDLMIFKNTGGEKRLCDVYNPYDINVAMKMSDSTITNVLGKFLYMANEYESNARISQIRNELENYKGKYKTAEDLTRALMSTEVYRNINKMRDTILFFQDTKAIPMIMMDEYLEEYSKLTGKKYTNYDDFLNSMKSKYNKVRKKFWEQAPKIAFDVFNDKNAHNLIDKEVNLPSTLEEYYEVFGTVQQ